MSPNYAVPEWVRRLVLGHIASVLYMRVTDVPAFSNNVEQGVIALSCHVGCRKSTSCINKSHRATGESLISTFGISVNAM
jgi:hypothetical protein